MPQPKLIQKRLRDEGDKLLALFDGLTPEQWQTVVYIDSMTWTIKDVLAHQIAAEREFQFYGRDVLNGGQGAPEGLVINEFNNRSVAAQADHSADVLPRRNESPQRNGHRVHRLRAIGRREHRCDP